MESASVQSPEEPNVTHKEPERPLVYEPPDLHGRKHVEKITTEYRVREDECLADRLQNEEFELHFGKNKLDNKILHMDVRTAKAIYLREIEDSGMLSKDELENLCKDDIFIAEEIEKRLNENKELVVQTKAAVEMQDEEFAIYLQAKEKQKLDEERKERLQRHIREDRDAAERLQRKLNTQVDEEAIEKGMSGVSLAKGEWSIECEVGSRPAKDVKGDVRAIKATQAEEEKCLRELEMEQRRIEEERDREQRRIEEERDRKIAIKLQRAEAEEYQRAKKGKQFRRVQTERRHEEHSAERKRQMQFINGNSKPRSTTPPERRRNEKPVDRVDTASRRQQRVEDAGQLVHTDSPKRAVDSNKKVLQSVDATGKPVHAPVSISVKATCERTPRKTQPPEEGIYLTAVDAIGAAQTTNTPQNNSSSRNRTYSEPPKRSSHNKNASGPTESWDRIDSLCHVTDDRQSRQTNNGTVHRNIAADIDPTYSTINHFSPMAKREVDVRPAPVVQNVKRSSSNDGEKKKKKWFSKKEASK